MFWSEAKLDNEDDILKEYARKYAKVLNTPNPRYIEAKEKALIKALVSQGLILPEEDAMGIGLELKEDQEHGREEARKRLIIADDPFLNECIVAKKAIDDLINTPLDELRVSQDPNHTGGRKFDGDKLQYGLVPPLALRETVKVLTFGAQKYEPDNWRRVPDGPRRYFDAAQRHIWAYKEGEIIDPESGVNHLAHAVCCLMFMLDLDEQK
jgi:hypothetical protein